MMVTIIFHELSCLHPDEKMNKYFFHLYICLWTGMSVLMFCISMAEMGLVQVMSKH